MGTHPCISLDPVALSLTPTPSIQRGLAKAREVRGARGTDGLSLQDQGKLVLFYLGLHSCLAQDGPKCPTKAHSAGQPHCRAKGLRG